MRWRVGAGHCSSGWCSQSPLVGGQLKVELGECFSSSGSKLESISVSGEEEKASSGWGSGVRLVLSLTVYPKAELLSLSFLSSLMGVGLGFAQL